MSLKDVLSWQSESISKALTFVTEKGLKKEAVNVFKLVQIYMSDRKNATIILFLMYCFWKIGPSKVFLDQYLAET